MCCAVCPALRRPDYGAAPALLGSLAGPIILLGCKNLLWLATIASFLGALGVSYHIFQVPEAFLENAEKGKEHFDKYFDAPPRSDRPGIDRSHSARAVAGAADPQPRPDLAQPTRPAVRGAGAR